jgi:very-short-patch-repair endonuclease
MPTEADLQIRAREMRRNPTEPETRLWRQLSNTRLGFKFRRQQVIFPYICDFFCPAKGLAIEVDGDTHDAAYDERRDARLLSQGYSTLRFSNHDVLGNMDGVLATIMATLRERPDRWPVRPHPNPSPEGEGLKA